jgi:hypothetical protein
VLAAIARDPPDRTGRTVAMHVSTSTLSASCLVAVGFASACAAELDLDLVEAESRAAAVSCKFNPGLQAPTLSSCVPQTPDRVDSLTFSVQTSLTSFFTIRGWSVGGPDLSGAARIRGCGARDTECEVLATPRCLLRGDGTIQVLPGLYAAGYSARTLFGDQERGNAGGEVPITACRELTAQLPVVVPPFVLQCVMNGAPYSEGSSSCTPNTARASNTIEFFIPSIPSIPAQFVRFEWEVLGATVLAGCGASNHTCLISASASNVGDRAFQAAVSVVDTRWNTWRTEAAIATLPAVCGRQFC